MGLYDNPTRMWFGTEQKMMWIETPQTGADVSSIGMSAEETLASGGGYVRNSWDSHKVFQFSWGNSATPSMVSLLQAYRNGSYGRSFLYFHDPMHYGTNLLPKRWADPSMAVNFEAEPLIPDVWPTATPIASTSNNYPINTASYTVPAGFSSQTAGGEHFIPIPPDMNLVLGAVYSGSPKIYVRTPAGVVDLIPMSTSDGNVVNYVVRNQPWARLGIRNPGAASNLSIVGMTARLLGDLAASEGAQRRNRFPAPIPTAVTGFTPTNATQSIVATGIQLASTLAGSGNGIRLNWSSAGSRPAVTPGETVTFSAESMSAGGYKSSLSMLFYDAAGTYMTGTIVTSADFGGTGTFQRGSVTGVVPAGAATVAFYLANSTTAAIPVGGTIVFRRIMLGDTGPYFDGNSPGATWDGAPNASTSTMITPITDPGAAGPWFSGEGHSGCRFVGNPTVVNYNGVSGGQFGLSAMFKEVGAWA